MKPVLQKLVAKVLNETAESIKNGKFNLDEEEMMELLSTVTHKRMNIEKVCYYFGISRATLNRWQECGKIPPFHKDSGGKCYLFQDEIDESVKRWNESHGIS